MRALRLAIALVFLLGLAGCGADQDTVMPNVVGRQLDVAKSDIKRAGVAGEVEVLGGGLLGILDESNWQVCEQLPAAGAVVSDTPRLTVARSCGSAAGPSEEASAGPAETPTEAGTPSSVPTPTKTKVKDITVDRLLDKLNSGKDGGIKVGDQFRVTGELFMSELWMTGASGDFFVMLKAQGGAQDLPVFVEESDAAGWEDGTKVEMVVEMVEVTINGETTDGWLRARSVKVIS